MIVEFIVACFLTPGTDVKQAFIELLVGILGDYGNDFEEDAIAEMVILRHRREGNETEDSGGMARQYTIIGFALELPEETEASDDVVEEFARGLADTEHGFHVLRFEDPILQTKLAEYSDEIFAIEMKLRRVLSLVYLHAYDDSEDAYNLLQDETVNPRSTPPPNKERMEAATENEFFHLYFSDYRELNKRRTPNLNGVIMLIQNTEQYEILRNELIRTDTINDTDDAVLLADLKQYMNPIEAMRNCVAHYRRPSNTIAANYDRVRSALDERLNQYLAEWEI